VWLKGDVAIAEWTFRAALASPAAKGREVGTTELAVLYFAPDGRVREEHDYMNEGFLQMQAEGDPDAPPLPEVPTTTEVHDGPPADERAAYAWANRYEDTASTDDAAAIQMLDERITWRCTLGFNAESRAPFSKVLAHWRAAFPDERSRADRVWPIEDFILVEETFTGTHKGKIGPFEGSGRPVTWHFAEVWQVKDGRIARGWSYANFKEVIPQITGAPLPAPKSEVPCTSEP
jgi:predicted ester cyclase